MRGGREFIVPSELQHVHDAAVERVISDHKKITEDKPGLEKAFEAFLGEVDVPLIQRLIWKQLSRAGVPESVVNRLHISNIYLSRDVAGAASHSFVTNQIKINEDVFERFCNAHMTPEQRMKSFISFAHTIVHEVVHSMSCIRGGFSAEERGNVTHVYNDGVSGFHTNKQNDSARYEAWNEAITERITDEIMIVYGRCKGLHSYDVAVNVLVENSPKQQSRDKYVTYRLIMQVITEKLAEYVGTTSETLWRGIKERYFSGGAFDDESIQSLFTETFGEKFLSDLSKVKGRIGKRKLKRFMNKYHLRVDTRTANRWFRELGLDYYLVPRHMQNKK